MYIVIYYVNNYPIKKYFKELHRAKIVFSILKHYYDKVELIERKGS